MKTKAPAFVFLFVICSVIFIYLLVASKESVLPSAMTPRVKYESIFNFGDSLSDTGNYLAIGAPSFPLIRRHPYGSTYFRNANGRASDGRLIVDFIAEAFGIPFLPPYLQQAGGLQVKTGVNFAVFGSTALDESFYRARNLSPLLITDASVSVQVGWFKEWKSQICATKQECNNYFKKSLFLVGNIGGNDYNLPLLFGGASIQQVRSLVPLVIHEIINATTTLIEEGAVNVVVPGNLPIGCLPAYLSRFQGSKQLDYNSITGCLNTLNKFSKYHNKLLVQALETLQKKYRQARIIYADYYGASMRFYKTPEFYGFSGRSLVACCGGGGLFNFNHSSICGALGSTVCDDPSSYASWDGIHWTEAAYRQIAKGLLHGPFASSPL